MSLSCLCSDLLSLRRSLRRHGHYAEKMSRAMMLGPLIGIIVNLVDAGAEPALGEMNDVVGVFASMDCPAVHCGLQYLLGYNWVGFCLILIHG